MKFLKMCPTMLLSLWLIGFTLMRFFIWAGGDNFIPTRSGDVAIQLMVTFGASAFIALFSMLFIFDY